MYFIQKILKITFIIIMFYGFLFSSESNYFSLAEFMVYRYYLELYAQRICHEALFNNNYEFAFDVGMYVYGDEWENAIQNIVPGPNFVHKEIQIKEQARLDLSKRFGQIRNDICI